MVRSHVVGQAKVLETQNNVKFHFYDLKKYINSSISEASNVRMTGSTTYEYGFGTLMGISISSKCIFMR